MFTPIGSLWRCAASLRIACAKCHIPKGKLCRYIVWFYGEFHISCSKRQYRQKCAVLPPWKVYISAQIHPKKHISPLRFFHIATLCNYHSPVKNAHCTFYCLANDTFSHSVCRSPDVPLKIRSSASQNRISCSFVRFAVPFGCLPARRSFLFSCRCSISASILSAVYSKPFWFSTRAHFARHILARP